MRLCLWHGWLLEGTGSNVYTGELAKRLRAAGHDVLLVCQERHPERLGFIDAAGTISAQGVVSELLPVPVDGAARGRAVILRPEEIGGVLPVFVLDEYEGWPAVARFVDLSDDQLERYLADNARALRAASLWHGSDVVVGGHAIPGAPIAQRALGTGRYSVKVHGSDLEYAISHQDRYAGLARDALEGAVAVTGSSLDVLRRIVVVAPSVADRVTVVSPGVDAARFRPGERATSLIEAAGRLDADPDTDRGRHDAVANRVRAAVAGRNPELLSAVADEYDQRVPDPGTAGRLRRLANKDGPLVGYLGKLIAPKGAERMIESLALIDAPARGLVVGFGGDREWLQALVGALDHGSVDDYEWIRDRGRLRLELRPDEVANARGLGTRVDFTGLLDHRYAPSALAAMDVLVVPSTLSEAFGIVAAEGAAAGALPLLARHSGLAEVAVALEAAIGRPGLLSFEPGEGATHRLAAALDRLLALPQAERDDLARAATAFVASEWTWERAAERAAAAWMPATD